MPETTGLMMKLGLYKKFRKEQKRFYWFNPKPEISWLVGDSRMREYIKHCNLYFSCPNLWQLGKAMSHL